MISELAYALFIIESAGLIKKQQYPASKLISELLKF